MSDDLPAGTPGEDELDLGEIVDDLSDQPEPEDLEPEDQEDEPPEPGEVEVEPRPTQRRRGEAQRWRERAERTERELQELRTRQQQPAPPSVDPGAAARAEQEKWERRAMMSPVELAQDMAREFEAAQRQSVLATQLQTQELFDKQTYDSEARTSRIHQQYRSRVEQLLQSERARGNLGATRSAILAYLVGQDAIERATKAAPQQRRAAAARVEGQRTRPTGARGDVATGRRRPAEGSLEADIALVNAAIARGESVF